MGARLVVSRVVNATATATLEVAGWGAAAAMEVEGTAMATTMKVVR